ncbi:MAG: phenylalanine--tRNA ligase subunit alpha [Candidatus Hodarchaeales archaeon]|jgi:phenylalanyl-tRNA synthetase alpha chain
MGSSEIDQIIEQLHPFELECLKIMKKGNMEKISTLTLSQKSSSLDLTKSNRAINWLKEKNVFIVSTEKKKAFKLTSSGLEVIQKGLPEIRLLKWFKKHSDIVTIKDALKKSGLDRKEFNVALGLLKKDQWIEILKGNVILTSDGLEEASKEKKSEKETIIEKIASNTLVTKSKTKEKIKDLIKRGLVEETVTSTINTGTFTELGKQVIDVFDEKEEYVDNLSADMISSGDWKKVKLRPYRVEVPVPPILAGKRHFYWQAIDYCRQIWLSLGFKEMEGTIVQTSFWNFDALFVPQDHPAREEQDTFFIKQPKSGKVDDLIYQNIADVHENGGSTGSKGWGGKFSREISESLVLRPHTTVLSAQTIRRMREEGYPAKYFAVGRCFRNEKIDWNHLAEFDQVEGIVVDPDVTFQDLLGYLKVFFKAMGFPKARFIPSYYPYTEPSVGIDVFHPIKKEWIDLGGSGVFRPELVEPILGEDIPVLAWGPGIGRIIKETYKITDIRRQYENDIDQLRNAPIWLR